MKTKFLFILVATCGATFAATAQEQFNLSGKITPHSIYDGGYLHLYHGTSRDSVPITNGTFSYTKNVRFPVLYNLVVAPKGKNFADIIFSNSNTPTPLWIYAEKGNATATITADDLMKSVVQGTANNDILQESRAFISVFLSEEQQLTAQDQHATSSKKRNDFAAQYKAIYTKRNEQLRQLIAKHPHAEASLDLLVRLVNPEKDPRTAEDLYSILDPEQQRTIKALRYSDRFYNALTVDIGDLAADFTLADPKGKKHSLSNFRGKYVLIDFWASWCGPCRAENPNLLEVYNKYKGKKFDIIGVSLDGGMEDSHQRWTRAIQEDKLSWLQVSDLGGWGSPVATEYAVNAIPMNYLIDPEGKIIAKNLRGESLEAELKKLDL